MRDVFVFPKVLRVQAIYRFHAHAQVYVCMCVSKWIYLSRPTGLLLPSVLCAVRICYVPPPEVHSLLNFFLCVEKWKELIMHDS